MKMAKSQPTRATRNQPVSRVPDPNDEVVRGRVRTAIEQTLTSKGFKQVSDPGAADFLVDYKFAVNRHSATVPVGYGGGYPGLVCGPYRCWESWGYGPAFVGYENIHFREGTIVFDWVQQGTRHLVYRAVGEKPVRRDALRYCAIRARNSRTRRARFRPCDRTAGSGRAWAHDGQETIMSVQRLGFLFRTLSSD